MVSAELFHVLVSTDSTNNYAMARLQEGPVRHGTAWFAIEQTNGRGQPGKQWQSEAGSNIALSIVASPRRIFTSNPFFFNAVVAYSCYTFFKKYAGDEVFIKWPNDIYWRDRKAGGILIENKYQGNEWKYAVIGIGFNINQEVFDVSLTSPVSLKNITGITFDPVGLARELHAAIIDSMYAENDFKKLLQLYNEVLYKKGMRVRLKKDSAVFETMISGVNSLGKLLTEDVLSREFDAGSVELLPDSV